MIEDLTKFPDDYFAVVTAYNRKLMQKVEEHIHAVAKSSSARWDYLQTISLSTLCILIYKITNNRVYSLLPNYSAHPNMILAADLFAEYMSDPTYILIDLISGRVWTEASIVDADMYISDTLNFPDLPEQYKGYVRLASEMGWSQYLYTFSPQNGYVYPDKADKGLIYLELPKMQQLWGSNLEDMFRLEVV